MLFVIYFFQLAFILYALNLIASIRKSNEELNETVKNLLKEIKEKNDK